MDFSFRGDDLIDINSKKNDLIFQISDWEEFDWEDKDAQEDTNDQGKQIVSGNAYNKKKVILDKKEYYIRIYGVDQDGNSVFVQTNNFKPHFYVEVPKKWRTDELRVFKRYMEKKIYYKFAKAIYNISFAKNHKNLYGFTAGETSNFIKIEFNSMDAFKAGRNCLKKPVEDKKLSKMPLKMKLFESNLQQMLRYMHIQDIEAANWVRIEKGTYRQNENRISNCQIDVSCDYSNIRPYEENYGQIAKFIVVSFDIECVDDYDGSFPIPSKEKNKTIQIGSTVRIVGESECCFRHMITLKDCDPIEGVTVESYKTEREVNMAWNRFIVKLDPDFITGWNINGFDFNYLVKRSELFLSCKKQFLKIGRIKDKQCEFVEETLKSAALGTNELKYIKMNGRVVIDLMKLSQRDFKLDSYKLDYVSSYFINGKVLSFNRIYDMDNSNVCDNSDSDEEESKIKAKEVKETTASSTPKAVYEIKTNNIIGLRENNYVGIFDNKDGKHKMKITNINYSEKTFHVNLPIDFDENAIDDFKFVKWGLSKDDLKPYEIFEFQKKSSMHRAIVAKYCIQDCELCNDLIDKISVIPNNIGMSCVTSVPLSYLFYRGQGIKIFSLVAKFCRSENILIPYLEKDEDVEQWYEGAIVLDPTPGIYVDIPITVMDFNSLYPNSMDAMNISHDTIIMDKKYLNHDDYYYNEIDYSLIFDDGIGNETMKCYFAVPKDKEYEYKYYEDTHVLYRDDGKNKDDSLITAGIGARAGSAYVNMNNDGDDDNDNNSGYNIMRKKGKNEKKEKRKVGRRAISTTKIKCYHTDITSPKGVMPRILKRLLGARKSTRARIPFENDPFKVSILEGLQLAYKLTANSLYGQVGSAVSQIYLKSLGLTTTSMGRCMIQYAKKYVEEHYPKVDVIYGDTDSIFCEFALEKKDKVDDVTKLRKCIELGIESAEGITAELPFPQRLVFEKNLYPFIQLSKKRYVGNLYEEDPTKFKQKSMGIVLKRRDNAPIVKTIYGGIINLILNNKNIDGSKEFFIKETKKLLDGKVDFDDLKISKSIKADADYMNPPGVSHKVLANKMGKRDPGNKPLPSDRVPYIFIDPDNYICFQTECMSHINPKDAKCRICLEIFCHEHLDLHECKAICRFCNISNKTVKKCPICFSFYCPIDFKKHNMKKDETLKECKKKTSRELKQGDLIEHPDFIKEHNWKIDYRYYFDKQVKNPVLQIFDLDMNNSEDLVSNLLRTNANKNNNQLEISSMFKQVSGGQTERIRIVKGCSKYLDTNERNKRKEEILKKEEDEKKRKDREKRNKSKKVQPNIFKSLEQNTKSTIYASSLKKKNEDGDDGDKYKNKSTECKDTKSKNQKIGFSFGKKTEKIKIKIRL